MVVPSGVAARARDGKLSDDELSHLRDELDAMAASLALLRVQTEQRVQRVQLHLALGGDFGSTVP